MTRADYRWSGIGNSAEDAISWCERRSALSWEEFATEHLKGVDPPMGIRGLDLIPWEEDDPPLEGVSCWQDAVGQVSLLNATYPEWQNRVYTTSPDLTPEQLMKNLKLLFDECQ